MIIIVLYKIHRSQISERQHFKGIKRLIYFTVKIIQLMKIIVIIYLNNFVMILNINIIDKITKVCLMY